MMEEKYLALSPQLKEQIQDFMEYATEFKNLALETLVVLDEERKKNMDDNVSDDEFEDAKSRATEFFEDSKYRELDIAYRNKLPVGRNPTQKFNI